MRGSPDGVAREEEAGGGGEAAQPWSIAQQQQHVGERVGGAQLEGLALLGRQRLLAGRHCSRKWQEVKSAGGSGGR